MRILIYSYHVEIEINNIGPKSGVRKVSIDYAFKKDAKEALSKLSNLYPTATVCEIERCFDISDSNQLREYQNLISRLFTTCTRQKSMSGEV